MITGPNQMIKLENNKRWKKGVYTVQSLGFGFENEKSILIDKWHSLVIIDKTDLIDKKSKESIFFPTLIDSLCDLSHALSTRFEPLYTNMYHKGTSDGAVSRYPLRLEIYGTISVLGLVMAVER